MPNAQETECLPASLLLEEAWPLGISASLPPPPPLPNNSLVPGKARGGTRGLARPPTWRIPGGPPVPRSVGRQHREKRKRPVPALLVPGFQRARDAVVPSKHSHPNPKHQPRCPLLNTDRTAPLYGGATGPPGRAGPWYRREEPGGVTHCCCDRGQSQLPGLPTESGNTQDNSWYSHTVMVAARATTQPGKWLFQEKRDSYSHGPRGPPKVQPSPHPAQSTSSLPHATRV